MRAKQVLLFTLIAGLAGLAQASAPQTAEALRQLYQPAKAPAVTVSSAESRTIFRRFIVQTPVYSQ